MKDFLRFSQIVLSIVCSEVLHADYFDSVSMFHFCRDCYIVSYRLSYRSFEISLGQRQSKLRGINFVISKYK